MEIFFFKDSSLSFEFDTRRLPLIGCQKSLTGKGGDPTTFYVQPIFYHFFKSVLISHLF